MGDLAANAGRQFNSVGESNDMQQLATQSTNVIAMPPPQVVSERGGFNHPDCRFTLSALEIRPGMPINDWVELGRFLKRAGDSVGIWRGDWVNYGKHEYKKKYEEAIALTGLAEGTLMNDVWVSKAIPISLRSEVLTSKHYKYLAPLKSKSKIRKWIERAIKGDKGKAWSASRLNKEINRTVMQVTDCETNTSYLDPHYKQFLLDYIASQQSFLNRCTYEPFKSEIERTIERAKYQLRRTENSDYQAVLDAVKQGASTVEEIAEDVPITERDIEVFCERAVGCPRPTKTEAQRSTGGQYEWRPIGKKNPHGLRPHGIFHKDAPSGDQFSSGYNPRVEYDGEEDHY